MVCPESGWGPLDSTGGDPKRPSLVFSVAWQACDDYWLNRTTSASCTVSVLYFTIKGGQTLIPAYTYVYCFIYMTCVIYIYSLFACGYRYLVFGSQIFHNEQLKLQWMEKCLQKWRQVRWLGLASQWELKLGIGGEERCRQKLSVFPGLPASIHSHGSSIPFVWFFMVVPFFWYQNVKYLLLHNTLFQHLVA